MIVRIHIVFVLSILLASSPFMNGQTAEWSVISKDDMAKEFEKMSATLKSASNYTMTVTHASYENYKTIAPFERSVGYYKKDKGNYHSFLLGIHTIQNAKYKVSVDTAAKVITVANNEKNSIFDTYQLQDYKDLLTLCTVIKTMIIGTDRQYRLEFKEGYALSANEFIIGNDGVLKEITLYYSKEVPVDPEDKNSHKGKPRLSISFSEYKKNVVFNKNEFDESVYFYKKGDKLILTDKYKQYELSDQRLSLNQ